jgi:serine/threonine protein kinase
MECYTPKERKICISATFFLVFNVLSRISLNHPHIVRVLDFGVEGNEPDVEQSSFDMEGSIPFLIMDYAPGGTLRGRYPKGTHVPLSEITGYVKQLADALQYAHNRKLIHRDVKPENMLLGQNNELLLSDFGIVTVAHGEHSMSTQEMAGTVSYIAPEQIKGKPRPASDQYALAVVVYEWLSGIRPFQGNSQWQIMDQHLSLSPTPLRERIASLPPAVDEVVLKALAKIPSQRFETISAFASALEQAAK